MINVLQPKRKPRSETKLEQQHPSNSKADEAMAAFRAQFKVKVFVAPCKEIPEAGDALFVGEDVKAGTLLTEYVGELIDWKEALERRKRGEASHIRGLLPLVYAIDGRFPEKSPHPGMGAKANDPRHDKSLVNAQIKNFHAEMNEFRRDPKHSLSYLEATRALKAGEQVWVDYQTGYDWSHVDEML